MSEKKEPEVEFDTSDVDNWVGVPIGGGTARYPISESDIARWVQAMHNPNPLYIRPEYAAESRFGRIVAPQSFTIAAGDGHGATPAIQGHVTGTHMLFGGDEWWFHGPRLFPGDKVSTEGMLFDYKVTHTKFAGPTMFSRGDTNYVNQRGQFIAKQRSTSIRYRADEARRLDAFKEDKDPIEWTDAEIEEVEQQRLAYLATLLDDHAPRKFESVKVDDKLPRRVLGPHSIATFTTEHRSRPSQVWGSRLPGARGRSSLWNAGWLPEMTTDRKKSAVDPEMGDGLYYGPSRGHVHAKYAQLIGMPREYGYGSSMGGWVLDYIENWAGEWGEISHCMMQYRNPAFAGDVTYLDGTVREAKRDPTTNQNLVTIHVNMSNQKGAVLARGFVEVELIDPASAES